jgi:perosamine synthetase
VTCFSFYANKTITTGEGGMAVTHREDLIARMKLMALHGLSRDAWERYSGGGTWDYRIVAPGFKYNMTDVAAAIGIHQLARAEEMRREREEVAREFGERLSGCDEIELPVFDENRVHSWHLFPIRLRLEKLSIDRNAFIEHLKTRGIGCSVHWRPLHLHPYYETTFAWTVEDLPIASAVWPRLVSLPVFPKMTMAERKAIISVVESICMEHRRELGG